MSPALVALLVGAASGVAYLGLTLLLGRRGEVGPVDPDTAGPWLVRHAPPRTGRLLHAIDRRVAGGATVAAAFVLVVVVAVAVGWVLDTVDEDRGLARWDESAAEWGARHATDASTVVLEWITHLGGTFVVAAAAVAIAVADHRRHRDLGAALHLGLVLGGIVVVNNLLKLLVDRERPDIAQLIGHSGASFPSGHAATAAAGWAVLMFVATRDAGRSVRRLGAAVAVGVAVAVAASRVLLGVHWLTDVVAGVFVGWGWFLLVTIVMGGRLERLGAPADVVPTEAVIEDPVGHR
jgi:undecaprenyl-diphosphatase